MRCAWWYSCGNGVYEEQVVVVCTLIHSVMVVFFFFFLFIKVENLGDKYIFFLFSTDL